MVASSSLSGTKVLGEGAQRERKAATKSCRMYSLSRPGAQVRLCSGSGVEDGGELGEQAGAQMVGHLRCQALALELSPWGSGGAM